MNKVLKYIPGFRSNKWWKKIIAIIYYVLVALMFSRVCQLEGGLKARPLDFTGFEGYKN